MTLTADRVSINRCPECLSVVKAEEHHDQCYRCWVALEPAGDVARFTPDNHGLTDAEVEALNFATAGWTECFRRSEREFDLHVEGVHAGGTFDGVRFSASLPLAFIREHPKGWSRRVFEMSDYPGMAGDWSAIRDSEPETIWRIFDYLRGASARKGR